jgi:CHASE2 domain-containing sensor protein
MSKQVVLKLGKGSFEQGFPAALVIREDGDLRSLEINGELPAEPTVPLCYSRWQTLYRNLNFPGRPIGLPKDPKNAATPEQCIAAANQLRDCLNAWLDAPSFRPLRETWLEQLSLTDKIRVIIQTDDAQLRRLPWHLWELMERYPQAESALSPLNYGIPPQTARAPHATVRILAILGDSAGIDVQTDRAVLAALSDAQITFLAEPDRQELSDRLWQQNWEILFFAGHSTSHPADHSGLIHLNEHETLTLSQLKHALEKAMQSGLQLAIFNSCDGLGLARELAYLQIPQLIVMREPVPDRVAQEFLKYFLSAYSQGASLYLAIKEARQRLQGWEGQFPCASWLPVLCQHPAVVPPTWSDLKGGQPAETEGQQQTAPSNQFSLNRPSSDLPSPLVPSSSPQSAKIRSAKKIPAKLPLLWVLASSVAIASLTIALRYAGLLQTWELKAFDQLVQMRPKEPQDSRILIIEVTEADVQAQQQQDPDQVPTRSLSDRALATLLSQLEPLQPAVIGLDIYRDFPASAPFANRLKQRLGMSDRLVSICKRSDPNSGQEGIPPAPEVPTDQALSRLGFSNVVLDADTVLRRHLLTMAASPTCPAEYGLSAQIALQYLARHQAKLNFTPEGNWQFGSTIIPAIAFPIGGYFKIDGQGQQILLNYRSPINGSSFHTPEDLAERISLSQALNGKLTPAQVNGKIILIGTTAQRFKDYLPTPYSTEQGAAKEIPGVMLQAQMVSQLVSAVLDLRPLFWAFPLWAEALWIGGWALAGGLLAVYVHRFSVWSVATGASIALLYGICFVLLIQLGCWVPLLPSAIASLSESTLIILSRLWLSRSLSNSTVPPE